MEHTLLAENDPAEDKLHPKSRETLTSPLDFATNLTLTDARITDEGAVEVEWSSDAPSSQFHAQDEFGQFSFGYENINSAKTETKDAFGVTRGSYQYVDANGIVQTVNYIADDINGFRVAGTNIPVAVAAAQPVAPAALPLVAPVPVLETPEVAAARAEHLAAHAEAKAAVDAANAKEEEL